MGIIKTNTAFIWQKRLSWVLKPLSFLYSVLMRLRSYVYKKGYFNSYKPSLPCVSVGNISWGGSGKTPIISYLLNLAHQQNINTVVLTRGYGSLANKNKTVPLVVENNLNVLETGDEALMLALKHNEAKIIVDPKRVRAVKALENKQLLPDYKAQLLLLDDGFQHLALKRAFDLVLFKTDDFTPAYWNKVIPLGSWREDKKALARASAFLCKLSQPLTLELAQLIKKRLAEFNKPLFPFILNAKGLHQVFTPQKDHINYFNELTNFANNINKQDYLFVSGIANPEQAKNSVVDFLGYEPKQTKFYADHYTFNQDDFKELLSFKLPIICTEKDAVKLKNLALSSKFNDLYYLEVEAKFFPCIFTGENFEAWLTKHRLFDSKYLQKHKKDLT